MIEFGRQRPGVGRELLSTACVDLLAALGDGADWQDGASLSVLGVPALGLTRPG
jgi:hypothetical protein